MMEKKTKNLILMDQIGIVQGGEYADNVEELKEVIVKLDNAKLFLTFLKTQGFNPNNYEQILELNQDVLGSVSLLLKEHQQFLLSEKVDYDELHKADICGAYGYVRRDGLFIPKTLEADYHFFGWHLPKKGSRKEYCYPYSKINEKGSEYDAIISNGISNADNFDLIFKSEVDFYLGEVIDTNASDYKEKRRKVLYQLNDIKKNVYALDSQVSTGKDNDKELILLSRTR